MFPLPSEQKSISTNSTKIQPKEKLVFCKGYDWAYLVIGTRCPATAKGLLAYHSTSWFIVDVKVAGAVYEFSLSKVNGLSVLRENGTGEGIRGCGVANI